MTDNPWRRVDARGSEEQRRIHRERVRLHLGSLVTGFVAALALLSLVLAAYVALLAAVAGR